MLGSDRTAASAGRLFPSDLDEVVGGVPDVFTSLQGARIFVTGGSGFIGRWMLESLLWANERLGLDVHATVLTRDPEAFASRSPHLARATDVELMRGDVQAFEFPSAKIDRVIHLAAETNTQLTNPDPEVYFDVIVGGTRRILDLVERVGASSLMIVSSGAVYGNQPASVDGLSEDDPFAPLPTRPGAAYGEAKRSAELLAYARAARGGFSVTVARCFAFVGPYLPLDS